MIGYWNPCLHSCVENIVSGGENWPIFICPKRYCDSRNLNLT